MPTHAGPPLTETDPGLSAFVDVRPRLFCIAYRMLGSVAEAEDIVQDTWLRWQTTQRSSVRHAAAFLATATIRLAINRTKSASARRQGHNRTWPAEHVDTSADPTTCAVRGEASRHALQLLLERLPPAERAAFVLREAFDYEYSEIAPILRSTEVNCRQLVVRARKHLAEGRQVAVDPAQQRRLAEAFRQAVQTGDLTTLERHFASELVPPGWRGVAWFAWHVVPASNDVAPPVPVCNHDS